VWQTARGEQEINKKSYNLTIGGMYEKDSLIFIDRPVRSGVDQSSQRGDEFTCPTDFG